jgi:predicted membrane channel-forming protein YqfA (hemolysin III family)
MLRIAASLLFGGILLFIFALFGGLTELGFVVMGVCWIFAFIAIIFNEVDKRKTRKNPNKA